MSTTPKNSQHRIVWLDLETGGLDERVHQVVQVAAVAAGLDFAVVETFEAKLLLQPGRYTDEALKLNSYDPVVWSTSAVGSSEARAQLGAFLSRHSTLERTSKAGRPYYIAELGGHNLEFDVRFLREWWAGSFLPASAWTGGWYDTLHLARAVTLVTGRRWESHKLGDLCDELGIGRPNHDALADVLATVQLAEALVAILRRHHG